MFRSFILLCVVLLLTCATIWAQNVSRKPEPIKTTPEMIALFDESLQSLSQAEPNIQAGGLFQLLSFALNFEDKTPALRAVEALLTLASSFESEELRSQLYEGVANALCTMGQYPEAVGVIDRIMPPSNRFEPQLNIGITIVRKFENEENNQEKVVTLFDVADLLRQAASGAAAAKNSDLEIAAKIFLGRELARQGKQTESAAAFADAAKGIPQIADLTRKDDTIGVLFQSQVQYNQMESAHETLKLVSDPQHKRLCASVLIRHEKFEDAERLLQSLPAGALKDSGFFEFAVATIKTITDDKIGELAGLIAAEEQRERFIQRMITELQKADRSEAAVQVGQRLKDPNNAKLVLLLGEVESHIAKKQFAEAIACVEETDADEAIRQYFHRQILMTQYRETHEEAVIAKIAETYSAEEKMTLDELKESANQAAAIPDPNDRMDLFLEVLQGQFQLMDIVSARQTIQLMSELLDTDRDIVRLVQTRLHFAQLLNEMQEKDGVKENLAKLMTALTAVTDLKTLKGLVPEQPLPTQQQPTDKGEGNGAIKLDLPQVSGETPVDESAIKDQLFQVYLISAHLLAGADAPVESKVAFEKAKELAKTETTAERKSEKLLLLAQILAEEEQN